MADRVRADDRDLTGVWSGLYTYPTGRSTWFVATLIDSGGAITGTTHEPSGAGNPPGATLFANLVGARRSVGVTFTKTYDRPDAWHDRPILYEGVLNPDATEIEGRWTIEKGWSGKFLMIRSRGEEVSAARHELART